MTDTNAIPVPVAKTLRELQPGDAVVLVTPGKHRKEVIRVSAVGRYIYVGHTYYNDETGAVVGGRWKKGLRPFLALLTYGLRDEIAGEERRRAVRLNAEVVYRYGVTVENGWAVVDPGVDKALADVANAIRRIAPGLGRAADHVMDMNKR